MEIKEALCCCPVHKFIKGRRKGRPVSHLLLSSEENCKMFKKKGVTISAKLCALQHIFCVQGAKYKQSNVQGLLA